MTFCFDGPRAPIEGRRFRAALLLDVFGLRFWTSSSMCDPVMVMDDPLAVVMFTVLR